MLAAAREAGTFVAGRTEGDLARDRQLTLALLKCGEIVGEAAARICMDLEGAGVRAKVDDRQTVSPGFKFHHWEVRGVPVRLELGPRDLQAGVVTASARNRPGRDAKFTIGLDAVVSEIPRRLSAIQREMFEEAVARRDAMTWEAATYDEYKAVSGEREGFCRVWWAGGPDEEERLQQETKATIRCIPLDQEGGEGACFMTGRPSRSMAIVARAY